MLKLVNKKSFDKNLASNELLKVMLKKIFREKWFIWTIHITIIIGLFSNGYYVLENFKISKNNKRTQDQGIQLGQDKKNLLDQNSFEFLDTYKDKIIKKAGFKKTGEEVIDISITDLNKDKKMSQQDIPNYQRWQKCLFTLNYQYELINDNEQLISNDLCR